MRSWRPLFVARVVASWPPPLRHVGPVPALLHEVLRVSYRDAAIVDADPAPEHVGPREACPYCGAKALKYDDGSYRGGSPLPAPRACDGDRRWFRVVCARDEPHLHQRCNVCGGAWTCAPKEAP